MPNMKWYSASGIMAVFSEAIRKIPGYNEYTADKEVKANIDLSKTKDNIAIAINPCMVTRGKHWKKDSQGIADRYKSLTGKTMRKDAALGSIIFTLPRSYLAKHDVRLSEAEYTALQKYNEADDGHAGLLNDHDRELAEAAIEKLTHIEWSDAEKASIKEYFEKAADALCTVCGIKQNDVLYAVVHMDESYPHMHFAFQPMEYGKATFDAAVEKYHTDIVTSGQKKTKGTPTVTINNITVPIYKGEKWIGLTGYTPQKDEKPSGCGRERFKMRFLQCLNKALEEEMMKRGIETQIATGKGQRFRVNELQKDMRREMTAAAITTEQTKAQHKELSEKNRDIRDEIKRNEQIKKAQSEEIAQQQKELSDVTASIGAKKDEAKGLDDALSEKIKIRDEVNGQIRNLSSQSAPLMERMKQLDALSTSSDIIAGAKKTLSGRTILTDAEVQAIRDRDTIGRNLSERERLVEAREASVIAREKSIDIEIEKRLPAVAKAVLEREKDVSEREDDCSKVEAALRLRENELKKKERQNQLNAEQIQLNQQKLERDRAEQDRIVEKLAESKFRKAWKKNVAPLIEKLHRAIDNVFDHVIAPVLNLFHFRTKHGYPLADYLREVIHIDQELQAGFSIQDFDIYPNQPMTDPYKKEVWDGLQKIGWTEDNVPQYDMEKDFDGIEIGDDD